MVFSLEGKLTLSLQLSIRNLFKSYNESFTVQVLQNLSINFIQGQSYAITGASGSGKSTIIHLLAGIDTPDSGAVFLGNENIGAFSAKRQACYFREDVSLVFQQPALFAELTVLENVMIKAIIAGQVTQESKNRALDLLQQVGLENKKDSYPSVLSGGQQQRVAILRAIFIVPKFLLLDEPTGNLDEETSAQVIDLLVDYHKKYGMGLIMSTHNQQIAGRMDNILHVQQGKLERVACHDQL